VNDFSHIPQKDFVLGGYGKEIVNPGGHGHGSFAGYIDEIRISDVPRYDIKEQFIPQGRFEPDVNTVALWHFDERPGGKVFFDSSPNRYDLAGKNGATVRGSLAVDQRNKLATTWAGIKAQD